MFSYLKGKPELDRRQRRSDCTPFALVRSEVGSAIPPQGLVLRSSSSVPLPFSFEFRYLVLKETGEILGSPA